MDQTFQLGDSQVDGPSLSEVCRRYVVKELSLFRVRRPRRNGPRQSLVEELESLAGRRVDLVTKRGLKPWVRPQVLKGARVIYAA